MKKSFLFLLLLIVSTFAQAYSVVQPSIKSWANPCGSGYITDLNQGVTCLNALYPASGGYTLNYTLKWYDAAVNGYDIAWGTEYFSCPVASPVFVLSTDKTTCTQTVTQCPINTVPNATTGVCEAPSCAAPAVWNTETQSCSVPCSARAGEEKFGILPASAMASMICNNGCQAFVVGASNQYKLTKDVPPLAAGTPVYVGSWVIESDSLTCTGSNALVSPPANETEASCALKGQGFISSGSNTVCVPVGTNTGAVSASGVPEATASGGSVSKTYTDPVTGQQVTVTSNTPAPSSASSSGSNPDYSSVLGSIDNSLKAIDNFNKDNVINPDMTVADGASPALGEKTINVNAITPVTVSTVAAVCPAPRQISVGGRPELFSYEIYCNFASSVKPVILAFAWLLAGGILLGAIKNG